MIEHCVEIEKAFFASKHAGQNQPRAISMTAPDQSFVRGDFATAERLFDEKVPFFESSAANSSGIDVMRYQLHLAEAQQGQGKVEKARATLTSASAAASAPGRYRRVRRTERRCLPISLLRLPSRPVPRILPAACAAIALTRLPRMKALRAAL